MTEQRSKHLSSMHWGKIYSLSNSNVQFEFTFIRIDDLKKVLTPLLSERKLSVQVVGTSEPGEKRHESLEEKIGATLKFYNGENCVSDLSVWRKTLKMNPMLFIVE